MKVNSFAKLGAGLACAAVIAGAAVAPAHADPAAGSYGKLVGLGSDTTQFVVGGLASAIPGDLLASYDANGASNTVTTQAGGTAIPRANGSGAGRDLLRVAIGQTPSASIPIYGGGAGGSLSIATADAAGQIHYARSSSGPGAQVDGGVLTYIPFALDAVSYATAPGSWIPTNLTTQQLTDIYKGDVRYVNAAGSLISGSAYDALDAAAKASYQQITTFLPQAGSGTRSFWLGKVGLTEAAVTANANGNLGAGVAQDFTGQIVQEHKGAALVSGTDAQNRATIVPFSIAQWVAQTNQAENVPDEREGAVINSINGTPATTGSGTSYVTNPSFSGTFTRQVFNIVPSVEAENEESDIYQAFVGTSSEVCKATDTIAKYGFVPLSATTGANACGDVSRTDYAASDSSFEVEVPASAGVGVATQFKVSNVVSNGNQGGTVTFYNGTVSEANKLVSVEIPAGQTGATANFVATQPGNLSVVADFVPALAGVAYATTEEPTQLSVAAQGSTTTVAVTKSVSFGKQATLTATVKPSGTVTATGKVTFKDGSKTLGTANLSNGKATLKTSKTLAAGSHKITAVYAGNSATGASTSKAATLKVTKAKATVKVASIKSVKAGKTATVKVTVTVANKAKTTGTITIKDGSKTVKKNVKLKNGKATVKIAKVKAGTHKVTVSFAGDKNVNKASAKKSFKVKR